MSYVSRTQMLIGSDGIARLAAARVAVFGLGGVGSYLVEALARAGVGHLTLVDGDTIAASNLNRQLIATCATIGLRKTDAARDRIHSINPNADVAVFSLFYDASTADAVPFAEFDYIADAIDTVTSKLLLIARAKAEGVPIISSMGTGNKLDPSRFRITDIEQTSVCPLARVMRRALKTRGLSDVKVLWSDEPPLTPLSPADGEEAASIHRRATPGSISFVPSVAGLLIAGEIIRDLLRK